MKLYLQFIILILVIILSYYYLSSKNIMENYETYSYGPYNYMDSGANPLTFYKYPAYRKPYMYPYKFYSSYPYPYMKNYEMNV
jgi:hypothetical protein